MQVHLHASTVAGGFAVLPRSLIDRVREREALCALALRPGPSMAVLFGRRRVGKTYLLKHPWSREAVLVGPRQYTDVVRSPRRAR